MEEGYQVIIRLVRVFTTILGERSIFSGKGTSSQSGTRTVPKWSISTLRLEPNSTEVVPFIKNLLSHSSRLAVSHCGWQARHLHGRERRRARSAQSASQVSCCASAEGFRSLRSGKLGQRFADAGLLHGDFQAAEVAAELIRNGLTLDIDA